MRYGSCVGSAPSSLRCSGLLHPWFQARTSYVVASLLWVHCLICFRKLSLLLTMLRRRRKSTMGIFSLQSCPHTFFLRIFTIHNHNSQGKYSSISFCSCGQQMWRSSAQNQPAYLSMSVRKHCFWHFQISKFLQQSKNATFVPIFITLLRLETYHDGSHALQNQSRHPSCPCRSWSQIYKKRFHGRNLEIFNGTWNLRSAAIQSFHHTLF